MYRIEFKNDKDDKGVMLSYRIENNNNLLSWFLVHYIMIEINRGILF